MNLCRLLQVGFLTLCLKTLKKHRLWIITTVAIVTISAKPSKTLEIFKHFQQNHTLESMTANF